MTDNSDAELFFNYADDISSDKAKRVDELTAAIGAFPRSIILEPGLKLLALQLLQAIEEWGDALKDLDVAAERLPHDDDDEPS